ncbi:bacteriohemerythrin [bacterium]|nr:bacteriohemerythrin [bacterium]
MSSWEKSYSVGIRELDAQHIELFRLLDELSEAIEDNLPLDIEYSVIKLDVYTLYHFVCEEHLMKKHGYPEFDAQVAEHEVFKRRVKDFRQRLDKDSAGLALEIKSFLYDWITNHIRTEDHKYGPFLSERMKSIPF